MSVWGRNGLDDDPQRMMLLKYLFTTSENPSHLTGFSAKQSLRCGSPMCTPFDPVLPLCSHPHKPKSLTTRSVTAQLQLLQQQQQQQASDSTSVLRSNAKERKSMTSYPDASNFSDVAWQAHKRCSGEKAERTQSANAQLIHKHTRVAWG